MTRIREVFGPIDVLINNAGIAHRSLFASTTPAVIRKVMSINFDGAVHCTHAALTDLLARRGQIIVISSVAGFAPLIGRTGYAASKHALHGFFDSLRSEVAPLGVGVLIACPSFIATGIDGRALGGDGTTLTRGKPMTGKPALPLEIATAICRAACTDRELLLPGAASKVSWCLSRLAPKRYARMMAQRLGSEFTHVNHEVC
jgi:NAD(P)-dependent dehydrogenase (short-subunit alcohol dehydrogenase family)